MTRSIPDSYPRSRTLAGVLFSLSPLLLPLAAVSCTTTTPAYDDARTLESARSMTPPAGQGVVVGRLKLAISDSRYHRSGDGLVLTGSDGTSYRVRTDDAGWFCVWLPSGSYRCESLVAYLGQPEWPVVSLIPPNAFEVVDQEVGYLGTLKATTRLEEAAIGYDLWIVVQDLRIVDEGTKAARELATRYGSPPPRIRTALLVFEEPE